MTDKTQVKDHGLQEVKQTPRMPTVKGLREIKSCSACQVPEGTNRLIPFNGEFFCESCHETHNSNIMPNDEWNHKAFTIFTELVAGTIPRCMSADVDRSMGRCAEQTVKAMKAFEGIKR